MLESVINYSRHDKGTIFEAITPDDVVIGVLHQVGSESEESYLPQEYDSEYDPPFSDVVIEAVGLPWQREEQTWIIDSIADALGLQKTV